MHIAIYKNKLNAPLFTIILCQITVFCSLDGII